MRINAIGSSGELLQAILSRSVRQGVPVSTATSADTVQLSSSGRSLAETTRSGIDSARAIMSRRDLRNISYTDLVQTANALRDAGALKAEDYLDFIGPSPEYATVSGERNKDWNVPNDYVALHEQQLAFLRSSGADSRFVEFAAYQLSLFKYFESLQGG